MKASLFVITLVGVITLGQGDVINGGLGLKGKFAWDPPTTNADGSVCTDLTGYRVYAFHFADDPRTNPVVVPVASWQTTDPTLSMTLIWPILSAAGIREGERIRILATAFDTSGNESDWSNSWEGFCDVTKPAPPGHVRGLAK